MRSMITLNEDPPRGAGLVEVREVKVVVNVWDEEGKVAVRVEGTDVEVGGKRVTVILRLNPRSREVVAGRVLAEREVENGARLGQARLVPEFVVAGGREESRWG